MYPIADLHCDLLCYLAGDSRRSAFDASVRCSIPQMQQGQVKLQVLPIFTETAAGSERKGMSQAAAFGALIKDYNDLVESIRSPKQLKMEKLGLMLSIENASSLFGEEEPLEQGFQRLETLEKNYGKVAYISFTWNMENRFGGGASTQIGLKPDGKAFLDYLHGKRIAFDCSHASDQLMEEALHYIDGQGLAIPIVASHSNLRAIHDVPRNLPDRLAQEILNRKGLIGLNLYRPFIGPGEIYNLARQLEHVLKLGGESQVCFGADFFYHGDLPPAYYKPPQEMFFAEVNDSSSYSYVLKLWQHALGLPSGTLQNLAHRNLENFFMENIF